MIGRFSGKSYTFKGVLVKTMDVPVDIQYIFNDIHTSSHVSWLLVYHNFPIIFPTSTASLCGKLIHPYPHLQDENGVLNVSELRSWESGAFETEAAMMSLLQEADKDSLGEKLGIQFFPLFFHLFSGMILKNITMKM